MLNIETSEDRQLCGEEDEEVPGVRLPVPGLDQRHREHRGHLADQRQLVGKDSRQKECTKVFGWLSSFAFTWLATINVFGRMLLTKLPNALILIETLQNRNTK